MLRRIALVSALVAIVATQPPASADLAAAAVQLTPIVTLNRPIAMAVRPMSSADARLYVAEKAGRVQRVDGTTTTEILDISSKVSARGERGLLGITFSPDGDALFVNYTNNVGDTVVKAFPFDGNAIDPATGVRIIKLRQPYPNHNGGNLMFGPDGFLYIGMGDGGGRDDPGNRAQDRGSRLGKMLRIEPLPDGGHANPTTNPYVGRPGRNETWARGLRNPWRWSFDDFGTGATGDLWIADVGGQTREEIDHQPSTSVGGENYGWRRMEGTRLHIGTRVPGSHVPPVYEYTHAGGNCAVTGGYVYRGTAIPDLVGAYLFADFCVGDVKAFMAGDPDPTPVDLGIHADALASFGRDTLGELYVLSLGGTVSRIDPVVP